jgi:CubicO group peptidase (beta-lactamase class C family)
VGSISKSFTAVAMAQPVAEGVFDLDERVSDYLPERLIRRN